VRDLARSDLHRAAEFCNRVRASDPAIEPFGAQLAKLAEAPRALRPLWRIAEDAEGAVEGLAFASLRQPANTSGGFAVTADVYVAVARRSRRKGLGRALCSPALRWAAQERATLRARVGDGALAGQAFLAALGFRQASAQILLTWSRQRVDGGSSASVRVRQLAAAEALPHLERLSREAWAGEPDGFAIGPDELAELCSEEGRLILVADAGGCAVGYLSGIWSATTLAIEEVAVVPERRREGVGRALLAAALRDARNAVLSVADSNDAARSLYRSFGFTQSARRLVYDLRHG